MQQQVNIYGWVLGGNSRLAQKRADDGKSVLLPFGYNIPGDSI
jgi:hypothetical protein